MTQNVETKNAFLPNIFAHKIQYPEYTKLNQEARALLLRGSVKTERQSSSLHQGKMHYVNQSSSQHQRSVQDDKVERGIDQTAIEDSELAKEDLMVPIESMPYHDQVIHSVQEMIPRM